MSFNTRDFLEEYPSTQVLDQLCGMKAVFTNSRYSKYLCPFHADRGPSLVAYHDGGVQCMAGCSIDGHHGKQASIISFVKELYKVGFSDAVQLISGRTYQPYEKRVAATDKKWMPDMAYINKAARNLPKALPYFLQRGIPEYYARKMKLGEKLHTVKSLKYQPIFGRLAGQTINHLPCSRYSIPTFRTNPRDKVFSISLRLNENDARERMSMIDPNLIKGIREDLLMRDVYSEKELLYSLFGPKYITLGSGQAIFNSELLANWDGTRWVYPHYDQLGVVESQFDAMILTLYGFPTVATKGNRYLQQAFQAVDELVIIRDNDLGGIELANGLLEQSGRTLGLNARMLDPYPCRKDVGEMYETGELCDWMYTHGLLQIERLKVS